VIRAATALAANHAEARQAECRRDSLATDPRSSGTIMKPTLAGALVMTLLAAVPVVAQQGGAPGREPVTPNASREATALLAYIQGLSGRHILSGQHNYPASGDRNSRFAADYIGKTPVVWSQDFGFADAGDKDSYLARPAIVQEAIRQHQKGAIITLCWHAVPPTADEPITFQPLPGADSTALASVQGRLLDRQFRDVLTSGTELHNRWLKQVDTIASFLKQLQAARVPVLWRPYHEMNGDWFWWGGRHEGQYTTAALYRQLFDRLVTHHHLDNLLWVWSVDRPSRPDRTFDKYYPGTEHLDLIALDVYGNDFDQSYYEGLMALSQGKPVVLGEVGNPPSLEVLATQPNWVYWVVWAGMVRGTSWADYEKLAADTRVLFMEDPVYLEGTRAYREASGLAPLTIDRSADFSGGWRLNESESRVPYFGLLSAPSRLDIVQEGKALRVRSTSIVEWADDQLMDQTLTLDGRDNVSTGPDDDRRVQNAAFSTARDTLTIETRTGEIRSTDIWTLRRRGKQLVIVHTTESRGGPVASILVYDRQ
jgi:mannan endo-1,4-beta-mannosidase